MSDDPGADTVTTRTEFERALGKLLADAVRNDIDPRGSWVYDDGEVPVANWEVEIYELE